MMLTLDAHSMTVWQSCRRRYELESTYRPILWRPKPLFDALLRRAVFALSNGADLAETAADACEQFLSTAANPGLDLTPGANPYTIARSWSGMLGVVLRVLAAGTLYKVAESPAVMLSSVLAWQPRAWADDSGMLHR